MAQLTWLSPIRERVERSPSVRRVIAPNVLHVSGHSLYECRMCAQHWNDDDPPSHLDACPVPVAEGELTATSESLSRLLRAVEVLEEAVEYIALEDCRYGSGRSCNPHDPIPCLACRARRALADVREG